jgi:hypothetical protein
VSSTWCAKMVDGWGGGETGVEGWAQWAGDGGMGRGIDRKLMAFREQTDSVYAEVRFSPPAVPFASLFFM